ncbi:MAG: PDZ domain-containing protein [Candidatus Melainabacteria bacterium]|nr:PDZ domain-containing protein [Candidatus Melainabacteria bacterium]
MFDESKSPASTRSGLSALRWAFIATLALGLAGAFGYGLAWGGVKILSFAGSLAPYMPVIAATMFALGSSGVMLLLGYLYFTGRAEVFTTWTRRLHPFFHLDSHMPEFPGRLGMNYRRVGVPFKEVSIWALSAAVVLSIFDYATGTLNTLSQTAVSGSEAFAQTQSAMAALAGLSGTNFIVTMLVSIVVVAVVQEFVFRGIVQNLWHAAFDTLARSLKSSQSAFSRAVGMVVEASAAYTAVLVAAALYAAVNPVNPLSAFFFALLAGIVYLQTRTIWAPVMLNILSKAVFLLVILTGVFGDTGYNYSATSTPVQPAAPAQAATTDATNTGNQPVSGPAIDANQAAAAGHSSIGIRVPGVHEAIKPDEGKVVKPLVSRADDETVIRADFAASGNTFIQVCLPADCAAQFADLEKLAKAYPDVEFVQADASKNKLLVGKLQAQQAAMAEAGKKAAAEAAKKATEKGKEAPEATAQGNETVAIPAPMVSAELTYPVHIYANDSMQVAPAGTTSEADLKKFIELNFRTYGESPEDGDDTQASYVSKLCNPENPDAFNGKVLYACVYDLIVNTDLALLNPEKRSAFEQKWEHKFDAGSELSSENGTEKAIRAMLADLNEMHTMFFTGKQFADMAQSFDNSLTGIGAPVTRLNMASKAEALGKNPSKEALVAFSKITEDTPIVVYPKPVEGGPAEKAGLKRGDRIIAIDGKTTVGKTINEVVAAIRGPAGTTVNLQVMRKAATGGSETLSLPIVRGKVQNREVNWWNLTDGSGRVAVKVDMFGDHVSKEFTQALYQACTGKAWPASPSALAQMVNAYNPEKDCASMKGLVIDLRNNPGGRLDQVVEMMQAIVKEGTIVTTLSREGDQIIEVKESVTAGDFRRERFADGKSVKLVTHPRMMRVTPAQMPIVVIVNEGSASASELMSSGLQKLGLATVVGTPSFGKEVGQSVNPIDFGAGLKVTTFRFLPGGFDLGVAVLPDFEASSDLAFRDNPVENVDNVMVKAEEVLALGSEALVKAKGADVQARKEAMAKAAKAEHDAREAAMLAAQKAGQPEVDE